MMVVVIGIVVAVGVLAIVLRAKRLGLQGGDFFKVDIPRKVDRPLAMGTRLDMASALGKSGVPREELRQLLDGNHDQELVDLYWRHKDLAAAKVVS